MTDFWEANEDKYAVVCGMSGKTIPPEDAGGCNNAEGCDNCPHNEDE